MVPGESEDALGCLPPIGTPLVVVAAAAAAAVVVVEDDDVAVRGGSDQ